VAPFQYRKGDRAKCYTGLWFDLIKSALLADGNRVAMIDHAPILVIGRKDRAGFNPCRIQPIPKRTGAGDIPSGNGHGNAFASLVGLAAPDGD
jgi:hypothetical protein